LAKRGKSNFGSRGEKGPVTSEKQREESRWGEGTKKHPPKTFLQGEGKTDDLDAGGKKS